MPAGRSQRTIVPAHTLPGSGHLPDRRHAKAPLRVAFVLRSFTFGGAEHDVIQLITRSDPRVLTCVGMAVQTPFPIAPDLPLDHPRVPPIYQPGAVTKHPRVVDAGSFEEAVRTLAATADVLVAWGVPDLAEVVPLDYRGRIVVTSKGSGAYQEGFLHANSLCTADYVANSSNSAEAFPAAVRHRVHVIYPGVDAHRLTGGLDRNQQRAAWGLKPSDRVVGYLGRISPEKQVEQLVEAVQRMGRQWKVVIVGRNGNFPDYEGRLARLCRRKLPGRHCIVDWTTDVGGALAAFDVLAYATEMEGFANTLAEAWLLGVPTVAREGVGAMAEPHWADCSITVAPDFTPSGLRRALRKANGNMQLVHRARSRAQRLTVPATINAWQQYLTRLARSPRRTRVMVLLPNGLIGGMASWLLTLFRQTSRIDWCCLCVMSETPEHAADPEVLDEVLRSGCPVVGIPRLGTRETQRRLLNAMRHTRPDVVLQCGVKRLDERYPDCDIPLVTVSHGPGNCAWARNVLTHSSRRAAHRLAISTTARDAFAPALRKGVSIITNGVPIPPLKDLGPAARRRARDAMGLTAGEIAVGYIGRLSPEKHPLCVARAMARLPTEYRAVFIGPDCANMLTEIRRIAPRALHIGPLSPRKAGALLPGLDVLVCPSEYESFGLAIVEAWAALVPVVSTRVGVVAELCDERDVSVMVPFDPSPRTLASAIERAIVEREQRIHICRALARKRYDARRMGRDWQEALRRIAGRELTLAPSAGRLCEGSGTRQQSDGRAGSRHRDIILRPDLVGAD